MKKTNIKIKKNLINLFLIAFFLIFLLACTTKLEESQKIKEIKERGKLIIGTSPPYGIMEFYEDDKIIGFDIDIAKEIAKSLNVDLEIRKIDFDKFENALNNDEIDLMISSITINYERENRMDFSIPYFNGGQSLVTKKLFDSYDLLEGKKILIEDDGTDIKKEIFNIISNFTPVFYKESEGKSYFEKALELIKNNEISAFVIDYVAAIDAIKENNELIILGIFTDEYYGIAAKKGNKNLIKYVDEIILKLKKNGELENIKKRWLDNK